MSNRCEWDDPHDGYKRFCLTHECWVTAPVTVPTCPVHDLLAQVQAVRDVVDQADDNADLIPVSRVRRALDGPG